MKKILLIFLLFSCYIVAQTTVAKKMVGNAIVFTDTLTTANPQVIHDVGYAHELVGFVVTNDSSAFDDTVTVELGTLRYSNTGAVTDTVYSYPAIKDSSWTLITSDKIVVPHEANNHGQRYFINDPFIQFIRYTLNNVVANRKLNIDTVVK